MEKVKLGDVCRVQGGYAFKSNEFTVNNVPVIRIGNIQDKKVNIDTNICYKEEFLLQHPEFKVEYGDILIAMSGATVGKVGKYLENNSALLNQRVGKFINSEKIDKDYLYFLLQSPLFEKFILNNAFGCAQPNISNKKIEEFSFYNYSIKEQNEITSKLNKVQEIIDIRKKQIEEMEQLVKSQFSKVFENCKCEKILVRDAIKKNYIEKPLDGNHGNKHPKSSDYVESGVPFLMANNIENGYVDLVNCNFITKEQANSLDKGFAKDNDVLITHKGTIGRTAILYTDYEYVMLTPQITYYRANNEYLLPEYLKAYFDSTRFQTVMKKIAGSGSTRAYIGITEQQNLELNIPSIELQNQFSEFVKLIDKQKFEIQKSLREMEKLQESLMNKYFG